MSQFGGILFALEQAVARDNASSNNDRNSNNDDAIQKSLTRKGGAENDQWNSSDENWEGHFDPGKEVPNVAGSDHFSPDAARSVEMNGKIPQKRNEEKFENNIPKEPSQLRETASEFVPVSEKQAQQVATIKGEKKKAGACRNKSGLEGTARREKNSRRRQQQLAGKRRVEKERHQLTKTVGGREFVADSRVRLTSSQGLHACGLGGDEDETVVEEKRKDPFPWLTFIPEGAVDPISLELLAENDYPPFALVVDEPYTPIHPGMWPPVDRNEDGTNINEDRELAILKQQWGDGVAVKSEKKEDDINALLLRRKFNLFDGHILANYLVGTQQFIDPFNRRDLTRGELEALDNYLAHNKLSFAGVCLAYDDRATISMAGSRAQTAAGRAAARAEILRQNAGSILNEMFTVRKSIIGASTMKKKGKSRDATSGAEKVKMIDQEAMNSLHRAEAVRGDNSCEFRDGDALEATLRLPTPDETGVYGGEGGGFLIIDDDVNPGLRGRVEVEDQAARHFPTLATTNGDSFNATAHNWGSQNSLSRVCEPAKMANPKLAEKRRKEEEAEKHSNAVEPPSTTEVAKTGVNPEKYAATLIARATMHLADVVKLEKKFIKFLADDAKPSLSLKPMASDSLRKLVEDYCKYWKLETIGFLDAARDPSQDVCIDCHKREETRVPHPLLSDAAKHPVLGNTVSFKKKKKGKKKTFELAFTG